MTADHLELVLTRHFAAPRERVYRAFVDEDQLAAWMGPTGFSVPRETVSIEARTGGHQRFAMVADDGSLTSPVDATFGELIENRLIVGYEDVAGNPGFEGTEQFTLSLEFFDADGGTRLELHQGPYSVDMERDARVGWMQSFDKLDSLLAA